MKTILQVSIKDSATKIHLLAFALLQLLVFPFFAQNTWTQRAPFPGYKTFYSVHFPTDSIGYLAGYQGAYSKTLDSGKTWSVANAITSTDLYDVYFRSNNLGFTVGASGKIYKTVNGGTNWTLQTTPTTDQLNCVYTLNDTIAFACGRYRTILKTTDGGTTWVKHSLTSSNASSFLNAIRFVNDTLGFAVGQKLNTTNNTGEIFRTTDGGVTWDSLTDNTTIFDDIYELNDSTVYLLGHTVNTFPSTKLSIYKTTDYGVNWSTEFVAYPGFLHTSAGRPNHFFFANDSTVYIPGEGGRILKVNLGDSTLSITTFAIGLVDFHDIAFVDDVTGNVAGDDGIIYQTNTGFSTWEQVSSGFGVSVRALAVSGQDSCVAIGDDAMREMSSDAGDSWRLMAGGGSSDWRDLVFTDKTTAYSVYKSGSGYILKSTDGGYNWSSMSFSGEEFTTLSFPEKNVGYAGGKNGAIYKTTNAGGTWTALTSGTTLELRGSYFLDKDKGFMVGAAGKVIRTTDGGATWDSLPTGLNKILMDVYFWDDSTGYTVGQTGTILKTTNGGSTWINQSVSASDFTSLYFFDDSTGFAAGGSSGTSTFTGATSNGFVYKTVDGGTTWTLNTISASTTNTGVNSIQFASTGEGYIGGYRGFMASTTNYALAVASQTNVSCNGASDGSATVQAYYGSVPFTYSWNPNVSSGASATGLSAGVYTVTVTNNSGAVIKTKVTITEPPVFTASVTASGSTTICQGDSVMLSASAGSTYQWSNNAITQNIYVSNSGNYSVAVTDVSGCVANTSAIAITVNAVPFVSDSTTAASCSTCADGSASANATGGSGAYTYLWSPGGQTTQSVSGLLPGTYTVCVTDTNGCLACDTVNVNFTTGVSSISSPNGISIYPNPSADGKFIIHSTVVAQRIEVCNLLGETVLIQNVNAKQATINLRHVSGGVYFYKIFSGNNISMGTGKLIVE